MHSIGCLDEVGERIVEPYFGTLTGDVLPRLDQNVMRARNNFWRYGAVLVAQQGSTALRSRGRGFISCMLLGFSLSVLCP